MSSHPEAARRASRLNGLFFDVLSGKRQIRTSKDAQLLIEAIRTQQPASVCTERILSSKHGLNALRDSLRNDLTPAFLFTHSFGLLRYFSDPGVKALVSGELLQDILVAIARPPTFWNTVVKLFLGHEIPEDGLDAFAWLTLELVSLPAEKGVDILEDASAIDTEGWILKAQAHSTRELGYKIKNVLQLRSSSNEVSDADGPGGRHDNDHADFRNIRIYPTTDEFLSTRVSFYRQTKEVFSESMTDRLRLHIDNQFRLLREDMLGELREDLQVALKMKKGKRKARSFGDLAPVSLEVGSQGKRYFKCSLAVECNSGFEPLEKMTVEKRRAFLISDPSFVKHQAFGALCHGRQIYGFAFINRDIELLARWPPVVLLEFTDSAGLYNALLGLASGSDDAQFVLVNTAVFSYEPVLNRLKEITDMPLHETLMNAEHEREAEPSQKLIQLIEELRNSPRDCAGTFKLMTSSVRVDESQLACLLSALTMQVSLIQGPPGTGKSFIGAQIAKCLHDFSDSRILVLSYTNHALDQFMEDLRKVGIPMQSMLRIGSKMKCSEATLPMHLSEQKGQLRRSSAAWDIINALKSDMSDVSAQLEESFSHFKKLQSSISWKEIGEYLEFSEDSHFHEALLVPTEGSGWKKTGARGKEITPDYLFQQWIRGHGPGIFADQIQGLPDSQEVWDMDHTQRRGNVDRWMKSILADHASAIRDQVGRFNDMQQRLDSHFADRNIDIIENKRIIGCTTTSAAKHSRLIRAARPDIILVEEAGEILESHILTSMAPSVKQLILIGDHKQLRPRVSNHALTVEKGDGFDLNMSLFERLIRQGASHTTLRKQHRMAPEISVFPRALTYPELLDAPKTSDRPTIQGLRDRVIFLNHSKMEENDTKISERRDPANTSRTNLFEAELVLRIIKYLGQQGYGADKMVILTPYLAQLRVLRDLLQKNQHDPQISDLDKFELLRAGLVTQAAVKASKTPLRISTIDNYQGEESDIVIASLTRSNGSGDIGFMASPERLNVLITRARNALVLIGNMDTFAKSKKGAKTWRPFLELLKDRNHLYDGLPVVCPKHPEMIAILGEPADFDKCCPDGGCSKLCGATLKCGTHKCELRCHRVTDHSKTECQEVAIRVCNRKHRVRTTCSKQQEDCRKCIEEDREAKRKAKRDKMLEAIRVQRQAAYASKLDELDDAIEYQRHLLKAEAEEEEQEKALSQRRADLAALKDTKERLKKQKEQMTEHANQANQQALAKQKEKKRHSAGAKSQSGLPQSAGEQWEFAKTFDGAQSAPLDTLMDMIGLEEVKKEFLSVKFKVDTAVRQGVSLSGERFSCSLLGNPGTGKTTVARIYGKFLTSVGVIPGACFEETTGAGLANLGVQGCKSLIEKILNDGGGVLFIDEAYQLSSGNSPGGKAVMDYLLPEVENLTGKIVFVLAGYNRQMESFFAHNPGLPSRFPIEIKFADYNDDELLRILELKIDNKYQGTMKCDDGLQGLYCRIVARRIGRGRDRDGFGNARTVENTLASIAKRQSDRLRRERWAGHKPDDLLFTQEDLIGPEPTEALAKCKAWKTLQSLIGLASVKEAVKSLVDSITQNYQRELAEQAPMEYTLNKVFLGSPGTGKTTVAKLYGEILVALGLLSKAEVVVKNPSDFVGAVLGQSEQQTKGILAATTGKVLVIDEAYGLYGGGGQPGGASDPYKTAVIDTIVAEVQSVPGEDRCVLLLGYKDQMENMFQNVNPGLSRRFPLSSAFNFEDFTDDELRDILELKLGQQDFTITAQGKDVAMETLGRARNRPNFGNAGEIDIILGVAKARHQRRISKGQTRHASVLEAQDFDENFDRADRPEANARKLFEGTVGSEETVKLLESYQETVRIMKSLEMDPKENIPFNFLFRGPPGTGKTTTARKMGTIFYDMGFLATAEVVECSATDLIGQYIGQTGPKVQAVLDKALGRVLFIDEAYRLAHDGHFAKEAIDELVDSTTKTKYYKKLIIILAGYEKDINRLMAVNSGLTSRFPEVINFRSLTPEECIELLTNLLQDKKKRLPPKVTLDLTPLEDAAAPSKTEVLRLFACLAAQDNWASARDVKTLANTIFNGIIKSQEGLKRGSFTLEMQTVETEMRAMLQERAGRRSQAATLADLVQLPPGPLAMDPRSVDGTTLITTSKASATLKEENQTTDNAAHQEEEAGAEKSLETANAPCGQESCVTRDPGVSDEAWEQLQRDQAAEREREEAFRRLQQEARRARAKARDEILKRLMEEERRRKQEAAVKAKLKALGCCPVGWEWIKQDGGYVCQAGGHFIANGDLPAV